MDPNPIDQAAAIVGSKASLAHLLGVTRAAVGQWSDSGRRVPAEHCPRIEAATKGAVRCEDLRPDVPWQVLRCGPRATGDAVHVLEGGVNAVQAA
ncbi:helix-turn-helix domain-containing protein [Rhizobacter sp. SG703]|uniref:transcriptional regulator n=1 Tax=Rhizobacter sp. SG703 TaxID=2587140 RepID=UPI001447E3B9|nr:helix-turn-helix domain-containing protein [Rhizobacter sp. SG703]